VISKKLFDIVPQLLSKDRKGEDNPSIKHLAFDSRDVKNDTLFFAIRGSAGDGHRFIDDAIENGATVIILEEFPKSINDKIVYVKVDDARSALAEVSDLFYNSPSREIQLIGVTGTNGKTTVCTLLYQMFRNMEIPCGLISTVKYEYGNVSQVASHTTPNPETFKNYLTTKKKFFDNLDKYAFVIYNADDKNGPVMVQNSKARRQAYSLFSLSDIKGKIISNTIEGLQLMVNEEIVFAQMAGKYNAYNLLAAYGVATQLGVERETILIELSKLRGAEGRFEIVRGQKKNIFGVVDYAHTPDALENILSTLQALKKPNSELISVIGCGGDRDKTKRPKMASIGLHLSDTLIITSDNPRTEEPESILDDMEKGIKESADNVIRITDRKQAIKTAIKLAKEGDIILVAGKGHEKYQDVNGVKYPFDDKKILEDLLLEK